MMKNSMSIVTILSATLVLPACRNDEATRVPETRTPYVEEAPMGLPDEDEDEDEEPMVEDEEAPDMEP
jgi:hypothetical protein